MMRKVKYKLLRDSNGYRTPSCILDGGHMWSNTGSLDSMILYGNANIAMSDNLPAGILEIINDEDIARHLEEQRNEALEKHKRQLYAQHCDPLFFEAFRDHFNGNDIKWDIYLQKCKKIHDTGEI